MSPLLLRLSWAHASEATTTTAHPPVVDVVVVFYFSSFVFNSFLLKNKFY
jgi:hypothetical protein